MILSKNDVNQSIALSDGVGETLKARANWLPLGFYWLVWIISFLFFSPAYYFFESEGALEFIIYNSLFALLFGFISYLIISFAAVLFVAKPVVSIESDRIVFPLIRFSISRDEVLTATPQQSGISENWRVKIKLKHDKPGRYRTWLICPTASAYRGHIYVYPMFLGPDRGLIKQRIAEALSPNTP